MTADPPTDGTRAVMMSPAWKQAAGEEEDEEHGVSAGEMQDKNSIGAGHRS